MAADFTRQHSHTFDPAEADILLAAAGGRFAVASEPGAGFSFAVDQATDAAFSVARYAIGGRWEASGEFEDLVVVSVTRGDYRWEIDGERGDAAGSPFLIRPGHDFACYAEGSEAVSIFLPPGMLQDVARTTSGDEDLNLVFDSAQTITPRHAEFMLTASTAAAEYMEAGTFRHPLVRASLFHSLSMAVLQSFPVSTDPRERTLTTAGKRRKFRRAATFIEDYASLPITVADIAGSAGVTLAQLNTAFRTHSGTTAQGYLQRVRLSAAHADLLVSDPASTDLTDLAARWGFADLDRFTRRYRSAYGVAPTVERSGAPSDAEPGEPAP